MVLTFRHRHLGSDPRGRLAVADVQRDEVEHAVDAAPQGRAAGGWRQRRCQCRCDRDRSRDIAEILRRHQREDGVEVHVKLRGQGVEARLPPPRRHWYAPSSAAKGGEQGRQAAIVIGAELREAPDQKRRVVRRHRCERDRANAAVLLGADRLLQQHCRAARASVDREVEHQHRDRRRQRATVDRVPIEAAIQRRERIVGDRQQVVAGRARVVSPPAEGRERDPAEG